VCDARPYVSSEVDQGVDEERRGVWRRELVADVISSISRALGMALASALPWAAGNIGAAFPWSTSVEPALPGVRGSPSSSKSLVMLAAMSLVRSIERVEDGDGVGQLVCGRVAGDPGG
jgi:hypothetical protein